VRRSTITTPTKTTEIPKDQARKLSRRACILNSAIDVFAQKGFHHARVSDVARAAGVADGTIYLYFKGKDDLLISLFEEKMQHIVETFRVKVHQKESAKERLKCFIELHLHMVASQPTLAEVLTVELRQSAKFMREYKAPQFAEYLNLLGEIITYGQNRGELKRQYDVSLLRRIIFGALDELSLYWVSTRKSSHTLDQAIDEMWSLCCGGLFRTDQ
jgi:TetR/AcrR family fatty acid metabolism transcriptional regulator